VFLNYCTAKCVDAPARPGSRNVCPHLSPFAPPLFAKSWVYQISFCFSSST